MKYLMFYFIVSVEHFRCSNTASVKDGTCLFLSNWQKLSLFIYTDLIFAQAKFITQSAWSQCEIPYKANLLIKPHQYGRVHLVTRAR